MSTVALVRHEDLEFRKTSFIGKDDHYYEIVRWEQADDIVDGKPYCYTILQWFRNSEGWDIRFVGDRPFTYITRDAMNADMTVEKFWAFIEYCQKHLDNEFSFEEKIKWCR